MIISHKYKFIFIKNGKTAGTSIEVFLSQICASSDIVTPIYPPVEPHLPRNYEGFYNRMTSAEIRTQIGEKTWKDYFKFCVERNPWDKVLSYYHMAKFRAGGNLSFNKFLSGEEFPINFPRYTEPGDKSRIIVDRVLYFENLLEGLSEVFQRLGLPFNGSLGVNAKSEYRANRRPYQEILTPLQADRIRDIFAVEIGLHGYRFNGARRSA
jgi:hypothetical protein